MQTENLILDISPDFNWTETFYTQLTATRVVLKSINFIDQQTRNHAISPIAILKCSMIDEPQKILCSFSPNNDNSIVCNTDFKISTTENVEFSLWTLDSEQDLIPWNQTKEINGFLNLIFIFYE